MSCVMFESNNERSNEKIGNQEIRIIRRIAKSNKESSPPRRTSATHVYIPDIRFEPSTRLHVALFPHSHTACKSTPEVSNLERITVPAGLIINRNDALMANIHMQSMSS